MKKLFFILLALLFYFSGYAQKKPIFNEHPPINRPNDAFFPINCSSPGSSPCNHIRNNDFIPANYDPNIDLNDPFGLGKVPEWYPASGTPNVYFPYTPFNDPPPAGTNGYFFAAADTYLDGNGQVAHNYEGVVQKITTLVPGHTYVMSFFKAKKDYTIAPIPTNFPIDRFNIRFIHCSDYNSTFDPNSTELPPVPANNQRVYCETVVDHITWQQVFIKFTAEQAFNMIWIYPDEDPILDRHAGLYFSHPELIDISAMQNLVIQGVQPGCVATLPSCGPLNSIYTWEGPNGQYIQNIPAGQAVQINVNAQTVGTWVATLSIPGAVITNNTCSNNINSVSFNVTIDPCSQPTSIWPKVYYTWYPQLTRDNSGNLFATINPTGNLSQNVNHLGTLPTQPYSQYYTFQYNNNAVTNWVKPGIFPLYVLNSGDIQMGSYTQSGMPAPISYINGTTGLPAPQPPFVLSNEIIIAETNGGGFITTDYNTIYYRSPNGNAQVNVPNWHLGYKFNPATNMLFVKDAWNGSLKVFDLSNNTFTPVGVSIPYTNLWIVQIDKADRVFVYTTNGLQQYDYITGQLLPPLNIAGMTNSSNIFPMFSSNTYTENRTLVHSTYDNKVYAIDFSNMTSTHADMFGAFHVESFVYVFNGNYAYIATCINANSSIGLQNLPVLPNLNEQSGFIAKVNLNDFTARPGSQKNVPVITNSVKLRISPNPPVNNLLTLRIREEDKESGSAYDILITNRIGRTVLQKRNVFSNSQIDISTLEKGSYFLTVVNAKGERMSEQFFKL